MIYSNIYSNIIISNLQAVILLTSFIVYLGLLVFNGREIFKLIKSAPFWLAMVNLGILIYKIFSISHIFSSRGDYGVWILGGAKIETLWSALRSTDAALYSFLIKLFSSVFHGISFNFMVNFDIWLSFINCFAIFVLVYSLFKDKTTASLAAFFYIISPIIFVFSLTEDFTNLAIFFSIQAICFLAIYFSNKNIHFLFLAIASSILAACSRPEYGIFAVLFIIFLLMFNNVLSKNKLYSILLLYLLLIFPRFIQTFFALMARTERGDAPINGALVNSSDNFFIILYKHLFVFRNNLDGGIHRLLEPHTLMGIFIAFFIIIFFIKKYRERFKKQLFFFGLYVIIFFVYYLYFHNEGFSTGYKYFSSLVFPVAVLAAAGGSALHSFLPTISKLILLLIFSYSMLAVSPAMKNKYDFAQYYSRNANSKIFNTAPSANTAPDVEYKLFLENRKKINVDEGLFIVNAQLSIAHSALPIREKNIISAPVGEKKWSDFIKKLSKRDTGKPIYISQGARAFAFQSPIINGAFSQSCYILVDPLVFEKMIEEYFNIDEKIFSFYTKGSEHIFLYKISLKK